MFFEMRFDLGTLDSGERSLPFGLLVCNTFPSFAAPVSVKLSELGSEADCKYTCLIIKEVWKQGNQVLGMSWPGKKKKHLTWKP